MSRSQRRLEAMRGVAELRAIGTKLAEARTLSARRALDRARGNVDAQQARLEAALSGWQGALAGGVFDPIAANFWGQAVNDAESGVANAKLRRRECEDAEKAERDAFGRATAHERCATGSVKRARFARAAELVRRQDDEQADAATARFARP